MVLTLQSLARVSRGYREVNTDYKYIIPGYPEGMNLGISLGRYGQHIGAHRCGRMAFPFILFILYV